MTLKPNDMPSWDEMKSLAAIRAALVRLQDHPSASRTDLAALASRMDDYKNGVRMMMHWSARKFVDLCASTEAVQARSVALATEVATLKTQLTDARADAAYYRESAPIVRTVERGADGQIAKSIERRGATRTPVGF